MVKKLGLALALLSFTAMAEPAPLECGQRARGHISFVRGDRYQRFPSEISGFGVDCMELTVGGTKNVVDQVDLRRGEGGRHLLSLLFRRPPAIGHEGAARLVGTVIKDATRTWYVGDIYILPADKEVNALKDAWFSISSGDWEHRGVFLYSSDES